MRLQLLVLACNLAKFLKHLALPGQVGKWTLTTLREKPVKIGAKVVGHARHVVLHLDEVTVPCQYLHTFRR